MVAPIPWRRKVILKLGACHDAVHVGGVFQPWAVPVLAVFGCFRSSSGMF